MRTLAGNTVWDSVQREYDKVRGTDNPANEVMLEMYTLLGKNYECARCGRKDLPLALFFEHNKSCAFESAISKSACELVDELAKSMDDLEQAQDRIDLLEMAGRDSLMTINWFERMLNGRKEPLTYDSSPCRVCGGKKEDHVMDQLKTDADYKKEQKVFNDAFHLMHVPSHYSVSYDACGVARVKNSICKALGPDAMSKYELQETCLRCKKCSGLFELSNLEYAVGDSGPMVCRWCK